MGILNSKVTNANVMFYRDEIAPPPNNLTFGEICEFWLGDHDRLSANEYYIHWLFPNDFIGRNKNASPFTAEEIEIFKNDEVIMHRFMCAFDLMLDFFGMRRRGIQFELLPNCDDRLLNLRKHTRHYMKITRILKCLRLLGLQDLWANWLQFLLQLITDGPLANAKASYHEFWNKT